MSKDVNSNEMKNEDVLVGDYIRSTNELIGSIKKYNKELIVKFIILIIFLGYFPMNLRTTLK